MIFLIGAFTVLHVLFYLKLTVGWSRIGVMKENNESFIPFTVIIPVRNEADTIDAILNRLNEQEYPKDFFEVIVVDDFSEDQTVTIAKKTMESLSISIRLIQLKDEARQGKKHALTAAVKEASFETILTTDADCWFGKEWIKSFNDAFESDTNMVAGPVVIEGQGFFARLQQVEFAGLMGFGAVTITEENPSMCSGANLGFRKKAFEEVGGYTNNLFTPSGDDEFLLFNIMQKFPNSARFLKSEKAIVNTPAHAKFYSFINQRTRWTSKWKHNMNRKVRISAILFFLDYLTFYGAIGLAIAGYLDTVPLALVIIVRFLSLLIYVSPINSFLKGKSSFWPLLFFQIIYPLHVLFMGFNSIFGSYTWKGRKYG
ncbi:MAG: glycosyltransferase [Ekhidna sp.]